MKAKGITLRDFYTDYNYPCWDLTLLEKNIVPLPYVPKDKLKCDHKYALTYKEWRVIVMSLFKHLLIYLKEGYELKLPHNLGFFQLKKRKSKTLDKLHFVNTGEKKYKKHPETNDYKPIIKWDRYKTRIVFKNKSLWRLTFPRNIWRDYIKELYDDFSKINKLNNI